ncbi:hypothetical protein [Oceanobacter antarcticus]|uniref:Secreted protein n=1 Tax=Oceanobacter antarcticus TaxID=3133425 RepID=A0ABW8NFP4_9GAMM
MRFKFTLLPIVLVYSSVVYAHTPVCQCQLQENQVICEGGYHDGSEAVGVTMTVLTYHGVTLANGKLDKASRFHFELPASPFYVLMDAGPGEMFEVDWSDIPGIDKHRFHAELSTSN